MITFEKFSGINNVSPTERLKSDELATATNVDIDLTGAVSRRSGYAQAHGSSHKNLWQADGFMLATVGGDLTTILPNGNRTIVHASLTDTPRVWYLNLPDGRTAYTNGIESGITSASAKTAWGVPIPDSIGTVLDVNGSLNPGSYQYQITYVRLSDGLEGGPEYSNPFSIADGGIQLISLPTLSGYKINIYITAVSGGQAYYAGSTVTDTFTYTGYNKDLIMPCRTEFMYPAPVGKCCAFWRGRALVAVGPVLYASMNGQWELFDLKRDFKQFSADITAVVGVDGGIWVGTDEELCFLAGTEFDKLVYRRAVDGAVVLGSGVPVRGELLPQREGGGLGAAMVCIADGVIVAGFSDGQIIRLTEGRYRTDATEVWATFRTINGIPQYVAIPR